MKPEDRKSVEGSVDVNGDITPITRQKVEQVQAADWSDQSAADLTAQLTVLQHRLGIAQQYSPHLTKPIQLGIRRLEHMINSKQQNDNGLI